MNKDRQQKILEIVEHEAIETQEDLLIRLKQAGFDTTQATVSRDIKRLQLIKVPSEGGRSHYAVPHITDFREDDKFLGILSQTVSGVQCASNIVVVRTYAGMANAACAAIDAMHSEYLLGSIAGDDTIFIVAAGANAAEELATVIRRAAKLDR